MKTQDIDISKFWGDGKATVMVKIKKFTFGEILAIQDEVTVVTMKGKTPIATPKLGLMRLVALEKGIVEAPFDVTKNAIAELEPDLGDFIYSAVDKFNNISTKKSTSSSSP